MDLLVSLYHYLLQLYQIINKPCFDPKKKTLFCFLKKYNKRWNVKQGRSLNKIFMTFQATIMKPERIISKAAQNPSSKMERIKLDFGFFFPTIILSMMSIILYFVGSHCVIYYVYQQIEAQYGILKLYSQWNLKVDKCLIITHGLNYEWMCMIVKRSITHFMQIFSDKIFGSWNMRWTALPIYECLGPIRHQYSIVNTKYNNSCTMDKWV